MAADLTGQTPESYIQGLATLYPPGAYPSHIDIFGKGGFVPLNDAVGASSQVDFINERIIEQRRKVGMFVYLSDINEYYRCSAITGNDNWERLYFAGRYFHGATAPTADDIQLGEKWFDTVVGSEYTYLPVAEGSTEFSWIDIDSIGSYGDGVGISGIDLYVDNTLVSSNTTSLKLTGGNNISITYTGDKYVISGSANEYYYGESLPGGVQFILGDKWFNPTIGTEFTYLQIDNNPNNLAWVDIDHVGIDQYVLKTGDTMSGTLTGTNASLSNSLVFTGNGKTAEFNSSGIILQADPSSFNIVAQNSYNNGYSGFDAANQKVINIDSSTNAGLWGGFNVKNQLAVGPETLYLNKRKPAAQPTYAASDAYLGGGVAGNSYPEEQIRFTETDMDFKYPSSTHVRKIINKNSQVPVWINGNTQRWLTTNLSTVIGNFSDAGPIRELAKGVITHHGRLFRSPETFENNTYTTVGSFTFVPDFTNDGVYLVGYHTHNTQLILGGYNKVDGETRMKLIYQPRPSYLSYDGNVYIDQVGGQIPRNLIEEKEYGLTSNTGQRKTAVLYTVNGIDPPLFYSGGLTSVGATAAIVVGFIDDQGEAWESEVDNVNASNRDPICQSPQVLFSYNMEKAQNNPSAGDFIDPNSYVDLLTTDSDVVGLYNKTYTIDKITYGNHQDYFYNHSKFVVKDTLVENFGNWSRLWNVYDHPVNDSIVNSSTASILGIASYVSHPEIIAIKYDTSDNRWKRGKLDNHTGVVTGDSGTTFRLCYSPCGMTSPWVDGINPAKSHYSFVTKGDEYYCDMDGAGATYYYNVYAGGYFDYKYNPTSIYEKAPINPCLDVKWRNTSYLDLLDRPGAPNPSDEEMCDNFEQYADQMNYKFPFVIYYKVRMSDGRIMDGPISAKLPIFDYDNSNVNEIKIDYNPRPYGEGNESAPIYNFYATPYIGNVINQMCANACAESYDYTVEKKMLNVFGGSVNYYTSSPNQPERSTAFAIRCAIGPTGTLEGGLTQDSDVRWRGMAEGLHWPGYPNIYTATNIGPLVRHRVPQYARYDEIGHGRCLMIGGVINDYVGRGSHSWQFPRGHLVRWSGYSYDNRDSAGLNVWTSTSPTFLNWQYLRKVFGTKSQGTLSDREWPNMEMLSRVGYNTNMGHAPGTTGNPQGAILSVPFALAQKIFETGLYTNTINPPSTQRRL